MARRDVLALVSAIYLGEILAFVIAINRKVLALVIAINLTNCACH